MTNPILNDSNHVTRQEATRLAAEAAGIIWPGTILPEGTALYESGLTKLKADRARWRKLPYAHEALDVVTAALAAEDRVDVARNVGALRLHATNGRLYGVNGDAAKTAKNMANAIGYDSHAFRQLLAQVPGCEAGVAPRGFASALLHLTDAERAAIINPRIPAGQREVTLRTKLSSNGQRIARAVLSDRYASISDIDVGEGIKKGLNGSIGNIRLDYKPGDAMSQFELILPSELSIKTFRVGDVHYGFVGISNSETGQGSLKVWSGLFRAACANLTLSMGEGVEVSLRHSGNADRVRTQLTAAIGQAVAQIEPLAHAIQESTQETIASFTTKPVSELMAAIAKKFEVDPARAAEWTKVYDAKYSMSPTTWGVTSAITEAAQQLDTWTVQGEEERAASKVLNVGLRVFLESSRETVAVRR